MAELKTFLFTDICGSVNLKNEMTGRSVTERDMAFIQNILLPHREGIEAHLEEHGGRVVSTAALLPPSHRTRGQETWTPP
jgi:hypothetical protein